MNCAAATLAVAFSVLAVSFASTSAKEAVPDQDSTRSSDGNGQPIGGGKPVTTTIIKRCPDDRELVMRVNGTYGCAKDVVPAN